MASAGPHEDACSAWELSKENVQPVKSGRDINCISAVLQPSEQDMERLFKEKQLFEEQIIAGSDSEDPLGPWNSYLNWTIQNFPSGGNDCTLVNLLKRLVEKFKTDQYINDVRYVRAWLKLAEIMKDPLEMFSFMNTEGIGSKSSEFYIAWADEYEKYGDMKHADRIYNDGDDKGAEPRELLQKRHMEFQLRFARSMLNNDFNNLKDDDNQPHRQALTQIEGKGKRQNAGTLRTKISLQASQTSIWKNNTRLNSGVVKQSGDFEVYEDDASHAPVMGAVGKWSSVPSDATQKENVQEAGPWKGVKVKQRYSHSSVASVPVPPPCNFTVYEDESSEASSAPHKASFKTGSVLSEKKDTPLEFSYLQFSNVTSAVHEKPAHESDVKSGYHADNIYTIMGEMQFEEVRAAFWRKQQKIKQEQEEKIRLIEFRRKLEEDKKQVEMEKAKYEMKKMELEKMCLQQELSDFREKSNQLEARLAEVKVLKKTAKTQEEEKMFQKEHEDITVQLNTMKKRLSLASVKFDGQPETITDKEIAAHHQMKSVISANNSLNHSKRSQPSPTVNTREALSEVGSWFLKPLDDEGIGCDVTMQDGHESCVVPSMRDRSAMPVAQEQNTDSFQIFNDEELEERFPSTPMLPKKGLTARPRTIATVEETKEIQPQFKGSQSIFNEDGANHVFDDATVSGIDFAAKACMASTPFCNKTEKLQSMAHDLGSIQPEIAEAVHLCHDSNGRTGVHKALATGSVQGLEEQLSANLFFTAETEIINEKPDDVKQLSLIMEASNESDKSSLTGTTKNKSEVDLAVMGLSLASRNLGHLCTQGEDSSFDEPVSTSEKMDDICKYGDKILSDEISCGLWEKNDNISPIVQKKSISNQSPLSHLIPPVSNPRSIDRPGPVEQDLGCGKADVSLSALLHSIEIEDVGPQSSLPIISNPWEKSLLDSIIERNGIQPSNSTTNIYHMSNDKLPKFTKGSSLVLAGEGFTIGKMKGEGAYAKVYEITSEAQNNKLVGKVELPPCPWETYAISHAKHRLRSIGMDDLADAIIDIHSTHLYNNGSLMLMPCMSKGTLLDMVNAKKGKEKIKCIVARWIALQVMSIIHGLHTVGFIHGDVKPDNFLVDAVDLKDFGSGVKGLKIIDFGRAIEITELPNGAAFMSNCGTSAFTCIQMKNKQPWNYHTDLYGIAGIMHVVLFGSYMTIRQKEDSQWTIVEKIKRWYNESLWKGFFDVLLNFPTPSESKLITLDDSPLPGLIEKMKVSLCQPSEGVESVNMFFRPL